MPCCNCNCKRPVLVVLSNTRGAGTFPDFFNALTPVLQQKYNWDSITVNLQSMIGLIYWKVD